MWWRKKCRRWWDSCGARRRGEDKEEKTEQAQGTSRTDTSLSPFLIFKKKMTEKLMEMAGVKLSKTKVLGILAEMWKTLDQDLKMKYEKT